MQSRDSIRSPDSELSSEILQRCPRYGHGQLLKAGNLLLVLEEKGNIRILQPDRKGPHPVTDSVQALDRKTWTHPVVIDDRLIIRNDQEIVCLQIPVL